MEKAASSKKPKAAGTGEPSASYGLHWFRRDLRIAGNAGLAWSQKEHKGRALGFFCWEGYAKRDRAGYPANQNLFLLRTVAALKEELEARGSGLIFFCEEPATALGTLFAQQKTQGVRTPATVSWNRGYEPEAQRLEESLQNFLTPKGILTHSERDQLLIEPHEIFKESNKKQPYQVYTPFSKQWLKVFRSAEIQARIAQQSKALAQYKRRTARPDDFELAPEQLVDKKFYAASSQRLATAIAELEAKVSITLPPAGALAAFQRLKDFDRELGSYHSQRDVPSIAGTSRFSAYLNNGSLTIDQIIAAYELKADEAEDSGRFKFFKELIWREFYYYILVRFPHVTVEPFQARYRNLAWDNREDWFERWKKGETGFPIVDAGMRELLSTGWMHNRVRMIVASFLCKDLLIDWRWGEQHFLEHLIDGDPALNNGGWQWAASTGCDPQPYFRIFNPELQSQRFDPEGLYIRKYVPELAHLRPPVIHKPGAKDRGRAYPAPLVDHALQKAKALALYKGAR